MAALVAPAAPRPVMSWGIAMLLVSAVCLSLLRVLAHGPAAALPQTMPAAAVMLVFSSQIAAPESPRALAVGAREAIAASARPDRRAPEREKRPVAARAAAPQIVAAEEAKQRPVAAPEPTPSPDARPVEAPAQLPSSASSSAAPAPAALRAAQAAAPFNSDAPSASAVHSSWQSLVLSHLGKYKRYPGDARQRKRAGAAWVRFTVNGQGRVLASELLTSSGTPVLDREALLLLERAQPLPPPPEQMVRQGQVTVTLPVQFNLENNGAA
ncbi:TonB family protein [Janthinobacterium fluminis]|uniref:TonB family protein n=1 Tax=Janthinobacterium fluminis TaxID=2987524 RepID=A0ABT5K2K7_9BURK|nr:TonB family protein [Janthinobacterium fluminis]MDC8759211.1 TonB family protein [Janthinobacterium fluminis]